MIVSRRRCRRVFAALCACATFAAGSAGAKSPTQAESDQAFRIFLNVKEQLVQECIYLPKDVAIVAGALAGLQRELDPEMAPYFPERLDAEFAKAFDQYQRTVRKLAALPELADSSVKRLVERSLRAYCRTLDRYSDYDDLETYERERKLKKSDYVGVGMTIERTPEGFDCYPFPGGAADLAGCFVGDRLLAVDGRSVRGLSAVDVGVMFAGPEGSAVQFTVRHRLDRKEETLRVERGKIVASSISVEQRRGGVEVRLRRLTSETVDDLRRFLRTAREGAPLTLDLRGCIGGELAASVEIAEMFLPAGTLICRVEMRAGKEEFRSKNPKPFPARPLVILQNKGTMSGAELMTVALAVSPAVRAETRGERSFGKGVVLADVLVNDGGGRLRFAIGRIYGPNREFWDGEGLSPTTEDLRPK